MICSTSWAEGSARVAKRWAARGGGPPTGLDLKTMRMSLATVRRGCAKGGAGGASAYLLGADEVVAEVASLFLREHHDLDGFLGETLRRWTGGVRKGQEGKLGGHDRRATCANLAFPVQESVPERRAAAQPRAPRPGSPRRGGAFGDRTDRIRECPGDYRPSCLGTRGRRGGRVRRHLAHAPRTWPSRRTSCRRARPLGSDARRSSGRRPPNGRPRGRRRPPRGGSRSWSRWTRARPPPRRRRGTEPCRHCGRSPWGERQWRWQRR